MRKNFNISKNENYGIDETRETSTSHEKEYDIVQSHNGSSEEHITVQQGNMTLPTAAR